MNHTFYRLVGCSNLSYMLGKKTSFDIRWIFWYRKPFNYNSHRHFYSSSHWLKVNLKSIFSIEIAPFNFHLISCNSHSRFLKGKFFFGRFFIKKKNLNYIKSLATLSCHSDDAFYMLCFSASNKRVKNRLFCPFITFGFFCLKHSDLTDREQENVSSSVTR